jgi:hypothetical protein
MVTIVHTFDATVSQVFPCAPSVDQNYCTAYGYSFQPEYGGTYDPFASIGGNTSTNVTETFTEISSVMVGGGFLVLDWIGLYGQAEGLGLNPDNGCYLQSSVNGLLTSKVYVNILTPGAGYTSYSGYVYPQYRPTLNIRPAISPSVLALLYWPGWATNYVLEECPDILLKNWVTNSLPVSLVNGTNEVTLSATNNAMFFRLMSQ